MDKSELDKAIKELKIEQPEDADDRENGWKRKVLEQYVVNKGLTKSSHKIVLPAKNNRLANVIEQLPKFRLFSNDNANSIDDKEHSTVIENEIKTIVAEQMETKINEINLAMQEGMQNTLSKINLIFKELFGFLGDDNFTLQDGNPKITFSKNGIVDKKGLSIENRGSGFRRLALLSLHLSTYEEDEYKNMILAIEEPETSQNPANQKGIILAIQKLIAQGARVIVTTHSPAIAKEFGYENVEYNIIENDGISSKKLDYNGGEAFDKIIDLLGILPLDTHGKNLIVFVEGIHDHAFLTRVGKDIFDVDDILFVPVGGKDSLAGYISTNIFKSLRIPYAGFLDKNTDLNNTEIRVTEALLKYRHATNFIKTKLPDISHYFDLEKRGKKNLHNKISNIKKLDKNMLKEFDEIKVWFDKFREFSTKMD